MRPMMVVWSWGYNNINIKWIDQENSLFVIILLDGRHIHKCTYVVLVNNVDISVHLWLDCMWEYSNTKKHLFLFFYLLFCTSSRDSWRCFSCCGVPSWLAFSSMRSCCEYYCFTNYSYLLMLYIFWMLFWIANWEMGSVLINWWSMVGY